MTKVTQLRLWPRKIWQRAAVLCAIAAFAAVLAIVLTGTSRSGNQSLPRAPSFSLPELGHPGQLVSLSAFAGRPVIVNFFASWCGPCRRETPLLAHFYRAHHGQIAVIGIDSADQQTAAVRFARGYDVAYPVGFDPTPAPVTAAYGVGGLPQTFFLNASHHVAGHVIGGLTRADLNSWAATLAKRRG